MIERNAKRSQSSDSRSGGPKVKTAETNYYEPDTRDLHSFQEAKPDSLAGCESETFGNRIHCCLVVCPAGRPITLNLVDDYDTPLVLELLGKDEDELIQTLWDLYTDLYAYQSKVMNFEAKDVSFTAAKNAAEFHLIIRFITILTYSDLCSASAGQSLLGPSICRNYLMLS